jgi:hypothetical protein
VLLHQHQHQQEALHKCWYQKHRRRNDAKVDRLACLWPRHRCPPPPLLILLLLKLAPVYGR